MSERSDAKHLARPLPREQHYAFDGVRAEPLARRRAFPGPWAGDAPRTADE